MRAKLDKQRYVSLSRDQRLEAAKSKGAEPAKIDAIKDDEIYVPGEEKMSLFDVHMPGVLTLEELQSQVDLDHWRLFIQGELVEFCVGNPCSYKLVTFVWRRADTFLIQDLVGWETADIKSSLSIKGITAELAATLGPKVVKNSVMDLFFTETVS